MSLTGPKDQAERLRELVDKEPSRKPRVLGDSYVNRYAYPAADPVGSVRVIAVASGKGGVGKTNFAVNLGITLARAGKRVALLDADLGLANIDIVLGLVPQYNLTNVLKGEKTLTQIIIPGPEGLSILAGGSGVYELADISPWHLDQFIKGFQELDNNLDVFLIDTGAGIGRPVLSFLKAAQDIIVLTTPEPTAVTDAYGLIKTLCLGKLEGNIKVVVNMAEDREEADQVFNRLNVACSKFLGIQVSLLGSVLKDPMVSKAVKEQVPFVISRPTSKASKCVTEIAARIVEEDELTENAGGLRALFKKVMGMAGA